MQQMSATGIPCFLHCLSCCAHLSEYIHKCGSLDANLRSAPTIAIGESFQPSNDPPLVAGCAICGGVDPMYGGTMPCPHCDQNLCPVCFPPTQHEPCCSSLSSSLEMILPDATAISSQYPFHFDTCGGKSASKVRQTTAEGLDESRAKACKRDGVAKRGGERSDR